MSASAGGVTPSVGTVSAHPITKPPVTPQTPRSQGPIWAVGGGKGGTGKTFISAALGLQLSRHGVNVNLVDADFGAPNLHTFLGVEEPACDLSDFFFGDQRPLKKILLNSGHKRLRLAAGSNRRFNLANIEYFRKQKLLRHIMSLKGQTIIDTGAGTALSSIEFFNISDLPILVINANPASIENMFLFLEAAALRILKLEIRLRRLQQAFSDYWVAVGKPPESVPALLQFARTVDGRCESAFRDALSRFKPFLIINKSRSDDDVLLGRCLVDVAKRCLRTHINYVGAVPFDGRVNDSLMRFSPFVSAYPDSETAVAVMLIMDRLLEHTECMGTVS